MGVYSMPKQQYNWVEVVNELALETVMRSETVELQLVSLVTLTRALNSINNPFKDIQYITATETRSFKRILE